MKRLIGSLVICILIISSVVVFANTDRIGQAFFNDVIKIVVDGRQLDAKPVTVILEGAVDGTNYVQARAIAEALGATVQWDGVNQRIIITSNASAQAGREAHTVTRVIDGDTFEIQNGQKVRLIGVDTPESVHPDAEKNTEFGKAASAYTKNMLEGKKVYLEKDVSETDRYGRLLRYVYLEDGTFYNELLVKEGYANPATYPPDVKYADVFLAAERYARENNKGLWGIQGSTVVTPTPAPVTQEYQFVGSKESSKYHKPGCRWAKEISAENLIIFSSKADAEAKGYTPCGVCKP